MTKMLVTRPEPDATLTAERLGALGIEAVLSPLLTLVPLDTGLPAADGFAAIALTSANALRALQQRGALAAYRHLPAFAVGDRTAAEARALGFADVVSAGGGLGELARLLAATGGHGPIFYPAARHQAGDLGRLMAAGGRLVVTAPVYDMIPARALAEPARAALLDDQLAAVLLYSTRTAQTFVALAEPLVPAHKRGAFAALCLSEAVAAPLLRSHYVRVSLADHPDEESMMALALAFSREQNTP